MSLVFRPRIFKDKQGDMIEIDEMEITYLYGSLDGVIWIKFGDDDRLEVCGLEEIQDAVEEKWEGGRFAPSKAKNLSKDLRERIRIFESLMESKGTEWTINEQLKLDMLREKLRRLQQEGEGEKGK